MTLKKEDDIPETERGSTHSVRGYGPAVRQTME
jgi:hypothetical protein